MTSRLIGWKAIADFLGLSVSATKMLFHRSGVRLPKIGSQGRTSCVYLDKGQLFSHTIKSGIRALNPKSNRIPVSTRAN